MKKLASKILFCFFILFYWIDKNCVLKKFKVKKQLKPMQLVLQSENLKTNNRKKFLSMKKQMIPKIKK